jgi:hypothetical protein
MSENNGEEKGLNGHATSGPIDESLIDPTGSMGDKPMFPGMHGLPFRGEAAPNLKNSDPDHLQPNIGAKVRVEILDLSNEKHLDQYRQIMQLVGNGIALISQERIEYDNDKCRFIVFLRWMEQFVYDPKRSAWGRWDNLQLR